MVQIPVIMCFSDLNAFRDWCSEIEILGSTISGKKFYFKISLHLLRTPKKWWAKKLDPEKKNQISFC